MKQVVVGALVGVGLVVAALGSPTFSSPILAQPTAGVTAEAELIAMSAQLADGKQQLTVIDPRQRAIVVYHVGPGEGEIVLKSVRNIHWDLQMTQFNGRPPLPEEIRNVLMQD
ncbi:MAG: hypothetical protein DWQ31_19475 [Planctomycetota bacterium]|nr:MAG: hypothetical protein DWQ31_19475 [Planctomycetota bacterium]REJ93288.1 MAG: hypothetical protein DWQ35_10635 [Planctomycetota bacterium]REK30201.1 MAG: hypothetical protein DWQ42_02150 [Planctomycetota bacterium]REK49261.1 MAG: hypothetical protein DWQ46_00615 [Planctomycetota bacterium]